MKNDVTHTSLFIDFAWGTSGPLGLLKVFKKILFAAIVDESTKGIQELVAKQRDPKTKSNIRRRTPGHFHISYPRNQPVILPRRGQSKPTLPAQLRSQLKQLLSHGPVRLSELESRYMAQFGKPLNITQYGFYSISEMLAAATDFVIMQQSRTGSQLLLRNAIMPQNQIKHLMTNLFKPCMYMIMEFLETEKLISCCCFWFRTIIYVFSMMITLQWHLLWWQNRSWSVLKQLRCQRGTSKICTPSMLFLNRSLWRQSTLLKKLFLRFVYLYEIRVIFRVALYINQYCWGKSSYSLRRNSDSRSSRRAPLAPSATSWKISYGRSDITALKLSLVSSSHLDLFFKYGSFFRL